MSKLLEPFSAMFGIFTDKRKANNKPNALS